MTWQREGFKGGKFFGKIFPTEIFLRREGESRRKKSPALTGDLNE
jgi:hypothetical protein